MLGHTVAFNYCRSINSGSPCRKIFDCWFESFPVEEFMNSHYSKQEIEKIIAPPKEKILSLLELIEQAKSSQKNNN